MSSRELDLILESGIKLANTELQKKSEDEIEFDTAVKWASRAVVQYRLVDSSKNSSDIIERFSQADDFRHEAYEHAAQVEDGGQLVNHLRDMLDSIRDNTLRSLRKSRI